MNIVLTAPPPLPVDPVFYGFCLFVCLVPFLLLYLLHMSGLSRVDGFLAMVKGLLAKVDLETSAIKPLRLRKSKTVALTAQK